jgi:hypothetical protein
VCGIYAYIHSYVQHALEYLDAVDMNAQEYVDAVLCLASSFREAKKNGFMSIMIDRNFVLVQKESNAKKESYCCSEPQRLFTKFTTKN